MTTDLFSVQVPFKDVDEALWTVMEVCDSSQIFPINYKSGEGKGIILQFLRNPSIAGYLYKNRIMDFVEETKKALGIGSVLIKSRNVRVDTNNLPKEIRLCNEISPLNEEEDSDFKKIDEDNLAGGKALEKFQEDLAAKKARNERKQRLEENAAKRAEAYACRKKEQEPVAKSQTKEDVTPLYNIEVDDYLLPGQLVLTF